MSDTKGTKDRGAVEEIIAKRLRPLNKKIQRFRSYHSKPVDTLNDDQRAALVSLPQLEAVARELEELTRAVEEAELVAAAKAREEREASERVFNARVEARLAEFHLSTASRLGSFLCLHSLLHPARPDDHDNLTFAPLALPLRLQDEVLATDILRVARMYGDLAAGGSEGHAVLVTLSSGPKGEDDENDRVHRLLDLLVSPETEDETSSQADAALEAQSTVPEPPQSVADDITTASEATPEGSLMNGGNDFDPLRTPLVSNVGLRAFDELPPAATLGRGVALNFLQEDELLAETEPIPEFEVVEPPSNAVSSRQSIIADSVTDWAADEESEETSAARLAQALGSESASPAPGNDEVEEVAVAVAAVVISETGTPAEPAQAAEPEATVAAPSTSAGEDERRRGGGRKPSGRARGERGGGERGERGERGMRGERGERRPKREASDKQADVGKGKPVDDDEFEVKTARRASASGRGGRGRGGPSGSGGGGRGRGTPREEGRREKTEGKDGSIGQGQGVTNGGGQRRAPRKDGGRAVSGNGKGAGKETKPKPSIYKTVQPTAPTSAPLL